MLNFFLRKSTLWDTFWGVHNADVLIFNTFEPNWCFNFLVFIQWVRAMSNSDQWATVRPMGNTFEPNWCRNSAKMMPMGNSEGNGQHFRPKARVLPIGRTHCNIQYIISHIKNVKVRKKGCPFDRIKKIYYQITRLVELTYVQFFGTYVYLI